MKKVCKAAALVLGAVISFGFASCKADTETEYITKEVTVEKEVPVDMTSHDATAVYHWKQTTSGVGYEQVIYEENEDGTQKSDESSNLVQIESAQTVAAGTKLADLSKNFYGFKAKGLVESLQADGSYAVHVYCDRNLVTITVTGGLSTSVTGLYGSDFDFSVINSQVEPGSFVSATDIPETFPAEDKTCTTALGTATIDTLDGFVKVPKGSFNRSSSSSSTAYTVTLTKDLYVCDHEVTQGEWEQYMAYYGNKPNDTVGKGEKYPVYFINWYEAVIYCNLLSIANYLTPAYFMMDGEDKKTDPADWVNISDSNIKKSETGKYYYNGSSANSVLDSADTKIQFDTTATGYRLPTEAEWKYVGKLL